MPQATSGSGKAPLCVQVITDTHYYSSKCGTSGSAYRRMERKSQGMIKDSGLVIDAAFNLLVQDQCTDIVLLSGDVTHDGEMDSHLEIIEKLRGLKARGKRVYVITATHDYQESGEARGFFGDQITPVRAAEREELRDLYWEFGPNEAIAVHPESMSYIVQLREGYRLFALNDDNPAEKGSGFNQALTGWVLEQLADAQAHRQYVVAMTHHPILSPSPFYAMIGKNDMQQHAAQTAETLADAGLHCMLTGHTHIHDISDCVTKAGNPFYDISTASLVGYPPAMRQVTFDPDAGQIRVTTQLIEAVPGLDTGGLPFPAYAKNFFIGMIGDVARAAATDIDHLADLTGTFSIPGETVRKFGWLIKPPAKLLQRLTFGTAAKWTRRETGLQSKDYAAIKDKKAVDFIEELVTNLYGGDAPYTPDTSEYKITVGLLHIIDAVCHTVGFRIGKVLKGAESVRGLVEPLLYNAGFCDAQAVLPLPGGETAMPVKKVFTDTVRPSKKGPAIVCVAGLCALLLALLLIATLPITLPIAFMIWLVKKLF